ncbi:MAG: VWA domain-containing protein [Thermoanaerobaculia bacterium]|nr:VWA domain-containing protein [Thermoanaerobaculia bacterium]
MKQASSHPTAAVATCVAVISILSSQVSGGHLEAQDDPPLEVTLRLPQLGVALFGEVELTAEIYPPDTDVERVEFFVDGRRRATVRQPPWSATVDVGQQNVAHEFVVHVYDATGHRTSSSADSPSIQIDDVLDVRLQQLYVAVENRARRRVLDLERGEFKIFDNGKRQKISTFERGDVPLSAVLLLDASSSMSGGRLDVAVGGARAFVEGMRELDQAKVILHSDRLVRETPFTSTSTDLEETLMDVETGGGTALNDHLFLALARLERVQGRRVVVILSDGIDVESALPIRYVSWIAHQLQPVIYWIRLVNSDVPAWEENPPFGEHHSYWRGYEQHQQEIDDLVQMVEESGGFIHAIRSIDEVDRSFRWILADLRNQYVLGYLPDATAGAGGKHEVEVRVAERGLRVRTRGSYLTSPPWPF